MKSLLTTILLAIASFAFSQSGKEIRINWVNNQFLIEKGDTSNLQLPFTLCFKEIDFNAKLIIWKNGNEVITGTTKKFGTDIKLAEGDNGYFQIKFELNEGKVFCNVLGETKLPKNSFSLEVLGKVFTLKYNASIKGGGDKGDGNNNEEQYSAGYIYYDAMALVSNKIPDSTKLKIYKSYGYEGQSGNDYLESFYRVADEGAKKIASQQVSIVGSPFLTNLGNTDVSYFAAGLARFLAERTKEELNEAFFSKMKEQLNAYPELITAFPQTSSMLNVIETYSYASVMQVLKEAFETDVQNLPENLYNIKGLTDGDCDKISICGKDKDCDGYTNCQARLRKLVEFFDTQDGHWVAIGMYSVKEGIQSTNPAELIKSIVSSTEFNTLKTASSKLKLYNDYNIAASIELSNIISQSLISKDDKLVWINSKQLDSLLFKQKGAFNIYLGLILALEQKKEKDKKVSFYNKNDNLIGFDSVLITAYLKCEELKPLIKNAYSAYNSANNAIKKMIAASEKSVEVDPQALYDYYRAFTSSIRPIAHNPVLDSLIHKDIGTAYDKVEQFLNPSVDIAYHISTKKYSAAIYDASILLSALSEYKFPVTDKNGNPEKDKKGNPKEEKYDGLKKVTKSFVKYGTLISTVANAQSSEEVKQALDASVLPVGSYSIKQNSRASFSINSYVGAYYSFSKTKSIPVSGLIAPIGFNFSQGVKKDNFFNKYLLMGGYSINLQLLDLGALVNYYLIKGDTATVPNDFNIKLSNIFSPGISVNYNIKKTPLSLAFGTQYIPTLYKYEQINGVNQLTPTNAWRWQLSLLVDIPMYNLKVWDFKK